MKPYGSDVGFGVLGPLIAAVDSRPLSLGGPTQRRLLAALVARAPGVVTVETLVDDVWGDAAPVTAVRTLHSHVTRLRGSLGREQPSAIETVNGGYRLALGRGELDAWIFEDMLQAARTEGLAPQVEATRLREALELWRGPAYGEFLGSAFADTESRRLEALREIALEDRVEADLESGLGSELVPELEALVAEHPFRERLWAALVVATYRSGRQAEALGVYQRARDLLLDELGVDPGPDLRAAEARVLAQDPFLLAATPTVSAICPWKGLAAYESADAAFFVGRERLVSELIARLVDNSVVVVTGSSGSGKSSVVRAGLVPALAGGAVLGSAEWRCTVVKPGEDPVASVSHALTDGADLLVLDQAEELFTSASSDALPSVAALLKDAVRHGTRLVLVVRGDMFGRLAELPELASIASSGTVLVGAPEPDELRRVVQVPARKVGLSVEPALVEAVVADVAGRPAALPLLSTALVRTWERCDGRRLQLAEYLAAGGTSTALERLAEETYAGLDDGGRAAARRILIRLATQDDGRWVRRRALLKEVSPPGDGAAAAALHSLAGRRLVVVGHDDVQLSHEALLVAWPRLAGWLDEHLAASAVVDHLSASAVAWATGGRESSDLYRGTRLQAALEVMDTNPEELGPLERAFVAEGRAQDGRELRESQAARRRLQFVALGLVGLLLVAIATAGVGVRMSRDARDAARVADAHRLGLQALTQSDPTKALLLAVAAVRLDDSVATESDLLAVLQDQDVPDATLSLDAPARHLAMSDDGWLAASGTAADIEVFQPDSTRAAQIRVPAEAGPVGSLQWFVGGHDQGLLIGASGRPPQLLSSDAATGVDSAPFARGWSPAAFAMTTDRRWVAGIPAVRTPSGAATLVTSNTDGLDQRTVQLAAPPVAVAAGPNATVVVAEDAPLLELVDVDGSVVTRHLPLPWKAVLLASSTGGRVAAVAGADGSLSVINLSTGTPIGTFAGLHAAPGALALSSDGTLLAATTRGASEVRVWAVATGLEQARIRTTAGPVQAMVWASDRHALYTAPADLAAVQTWEVSADRGVATAVLATGPAGAGKATASAVDPISRTLAVGTDAGSVWFLDLATRRVTTAAPASPDGDAIASVSFADQGRIAVSSDVRGAITAWDVALGRRLGELAPDGGANGEGTNADVGPDDRTVASFPDGFGLRLFDVPRRQELRLTYYPDLGTHTFLQVVGWCPDGRSVLVWGPGLESGTAGVLARVDVNGDRVIWSVPAAEPIVAGVAVIADGSALVVSGRSGGLHVLDTSTGATTTVGQLADSGIASSRATYSPLSLSTSPDGGLLSTAGATRPIHLWDARTGQPLGDVAPQGTVLAARFLSDTELVGLTADGRVDVYDVTVGGWIARACRAAGRDLSAAEWAQVLPNYAYQAPCA